mmetsp:Transcript_528/g.1242  ORF Transcript_528/g.1242 Transcript_528/m.1242 type:complete len:221 (+) Transcript_528:276-938(+)
MSTPTKNTTLIAPTEDEGVLTTPNSTISPMLLASAGGKANPADTIQGIAPAGGGRPIIAVAASLSVVAVLAVILVVTRFRHSRNPPNAANNVKDEKEGKTLVEDEKDGKTVIALAQRQKAAATRKKKWLGWGRTIFFWIVGLHLIAWVVDKYPYFFPVAFLVYISRPLVRLAKSYNSREDDNADNDISTTSPKSKPNSTGKKSRGRGRKRNGQGRRKNKA